MKERKRYTLGKRLTIPAGTEMMLSSFYKHTSLIPTYELLIGIGKDHTARLIIDKESHEALMNGAQINISTANEPV